MKDSSRGNRTIVLLTAGLLSWLVPGGGYFFLNEKRRALVILISITVTFVIGLHIGSIGVVSTKSWWFLAQVLFNPATFLLARITSGGNYQVFGKPQEIGQIYTGVAGLLNLLCIVSCMYFAHCRTKAS